MKLTRALFVLGAVGAIGASAAPAYALPATPAGWSAAFAALPTYGDGNLSCKIDAGRIVFLTGDATTRAGGDGPHSTITVADSAGVHVARPAYPGVASPYQVVPERPTDGSFHWLGPCLYSAGRLYVFSPYVTAVGAGIRTDLLVFTVQAGRDPVYAYSRVLPRSWSAGVWLDLKTQMVYWFGASAQGTDGWTGRDVYVARTPLTRIGDPASWVFWNRPGFWAKTGERPILAALRDGGVDLAFAVWQDGAGWHITSRWGGPWGTRNGQAEIHRWTSTTWTGWSTVRLATVDPAAYLVFEHRTVKPGLLTYNRAGQDAAWLQVNG